MNISNRSRYGLRAIVYIASKRDEKVSIKEISEKEDIPKRYLEQIFAELKKGDIIKSIKGTKGGYFLSNTAKETTVGQVLRILEGTLDVLEGGMKELNEVEGIEYTLINQVWNKMSDALYEVVDHITIADIIEKYNETNQIMYYI